MGFFSWLANGLGTVLGAVTEVVSTVVQTVRTAYEAFAGRAVPPGPSQSRVAGCRRS